MGNEKYSDVEIATFKKRFLEELWIYRVNKKAKVITGKVVCTNARFNSFIHNKWSKRSWRVQHITKNDYIAECIFITHEALEKFDVKNGNFNWNNLFLEDDNYEKRVIFKFLITSIDNGTKSFENWHMNRKKYSATKKIDGKNEHFYEFVDINFSSTDNLAQGNFDGDEEKAINLLGDGASIYTNHNENEMMFVSWNPNRKNHFLQWFHENKERVIPELWLKRYEKMVVNEVTDYGEKPYGNREREIVTGMKTSEFGNTYKFVRKYALAAYEKEFGEGLNLLESTRREQLALLNEFMDLINNDMEDKPHRFELTNWVIKNMKKSRMLSDLIYDKLDAEQTQTIVKGFMGHLFPNETVYLITNMIEEKIAQLESFDTTTVKFHKKDTEKKPVLRLIVNENYVEPSAEEKKLREKYRYYNLTTTGATVELIHNK